MIQFNRREIVKEMRDFYMEGHLSKDMYKFALMTDKEILTYYQTIYKDEKRRTKSNNRDATI